MQKFLTTIALATIISAPAMADVGCDFGEPMLTLRSNSCEAPRYIRLQMSEFVPAYLDGVYASSAPVERRSPRFISRVLTDINEYTDLKGGSGG